MATGRIKGIERVYAFVHSIPFRTTRRSLERANSYVQTLSEERVEVLVGCGGGAGRRKYVAGLLRVYALLLDHLQEVPHSEIQTGT